MGENGTMTSVVIMALTVAAMLEGGVSLRFPTKADGKAMGIVERNTLEKGKKNFTHAFINVRAGGREAVCYEDDKVGNNGVLCKALSLRSRACQNAWLDIQVEAKNTGLRGDASESVSLFWSPPESTVLNVSPKKQVLSSKTVTVKKGSAQSLQFSVDVCKDMSFVGTDGIRQVAQGVHVFNIAEASHRLYVTFPYH